MDVHAQGGNERMRRRVIALLVAFAALAERVADRSAPVRFFVLWILRRAETAAADFVFEEAGIPPAALERPEGLEGITVAGNGPADALRLAARFTALAAMLRALLPVDCPFCRRPTRDSFAFDHAPAGAFRRPVAWWLKPYDTS